LRDVQLASGSRQRACSSNCHDELEIGPIHTAMVGMSRDANRLTRTLAACSCGRR
jgi:hypothetical protein